MVLRPVLKVGDSARRSRTITARVIELFNKLTGDRNPFTTTRAEEAARLSRASSCKWRTSELLDTVVAEDFRVPGARFFTGKAGRPALPILRAPWLQPVDLGPGSVAQSVGTIGARRASHGWRSNAKLQVRVAEGVGLEPTSPFGQRFSSVWPGVLTSPAYFCLMLIVHVSDRTTS
jgi:hypothetical protein